MAEYQDINFLLGKALAYFGHAELFEPVWRHPEFILTAANMKGVFWRMRMSPNGVVQPCSCPASNPSWPGTPYIKAAFALHQLTLAR